MSKEFLQAVEERRSYYNINNTKTVSEARIEEIVAHGIKYAPSAYNSQSGRVIILFDEAHQNLWKLTEQALQKVVKPERLAATKEKLDTFGAGYGTILFFEDQETVRALQARFPLYKDNYPLWSLQSSGMLQYIIWAALEAEGLGASLQHYNPLIDQSVQETWNVPAHWRLISQMPFGSPFQKPEDKTFLPLEERLRVIK